MAHFAELNKENEVLRVIVIGNSDILVNGVESEDAGIAFCRKLFGEETIWKQTSYNNNIRYNYAGIGYTYDLENDAFIAPCPGEEYILNTENYQWELKE